MSPASLLSGGRAVGPQVLMGAGGLLTATVGGQVTVREVHTALNGSAQVHRGTWSREDHHQMADEALAMLAAYLQATGAEPADTSEEVVERWLRSQDPTVPLGVVDTTQAEAADFWRQELTEASREHSGGRRRTGQRGNPRRTEEPARQADRAGGAGDGPERLVLDTAASGSAVASWWHQAACAGFDPSWWTSEEVGTWQGAVRLCIGCPVRGTCLEEASRLGDVGVIRGGVLFTATNRNGRVARSWICARCGRWPARSRQDVPQGRFCRWCAAAVKKAASDRLAADRRRSGAGGQG